MKVQARLLRKQSTWPEKKLWSLLRNRKFHNFKFRRQYLLGGYIVDFICIEKMLIIELDGNHHLSQIEDDHNRTVYLEELGFRVLRFWNEQVLKNIDAVLQEIYHHLVDYPPTSGDRCLYPLPLAGEGAQRAGEG